MKRIDPLFWIGIGAFGGIIVALALSNAATISTAAIVENIQAVTPFILSMLMVLGLWLYLQHRHRLGDFDQQHQPSVSTSGSYSQGATAAARTGAYHHSYYVQVRWLQNGRMQPVTVAIPMGDMQRLFSQCHDTQQAEKLVHRAVQQTPGKPGRWYVEKVLEELTWSRRPNSSPRRNPSSSPRPTAVHPSSSSANIPAEAIAELTTYTHSPQTSERLLGKLASRHPGQPWSWLVSKAIYDITRDRR